MKFNFFSCMAFCLLVLASCQREISVDLGAPANGGSSGTTTGQRLIKDISTDNGFSDTLSLGYDASGRLISYDNTGKDNTGHPMYLHARHFRDAAGILQKSVWKTDSTAAGIDSTVIYPHYDAALQLYTSAVELITASGVTMKDSVIFVYDASKRLVTNKTFEDSLTGNGYKPIEIDAYTYVGNNVHDKHQSLYDAATSSFIPGDVYIYEYDTKTNPWQLGMESVIIAGAFEKGFSANNITKTSANRVLTSSWVETDSYTYNASGLPVSSISVLGTATWTEVYIYQ